MCCDNLPSNGHVLKKLVLQMSDEVDPTGELSAWIGQSGAVGFPSSMVDRITPAALPDTGKRFVLSKFGAPEDPCLAPVQAEDFHQWVVESEVTTRSNI